jgi:hypothetical protein
MAAIAATIGPPAGSSEPATSDGGSPADGASTGWIVPWLHRATTGEACPHPDPNPRDEAAVDTTTTTATTRRPASMTSPDTPPAAPPPDAGSESPVRVVLRFLEYGVTLVALQSIGADRQPSQADCREVRSWLEYGIPPIPIRLILAEEYQRARRKRGPDADLSDLQLFDEAVRRAWLWRFKTGLSATGYPADAAASETSADLAREAPPASSITA